MSKSEPMNEIDPDFEGTFLRAIVGDVIAATKRNDESSTPETRRSVIRTTAAAVEGLAWHYCNFVISAATEVSEIHPAEKLAMEEFSYSLDETGKVRSRRQTLAPLAIIRFTASLVKRLDAAQTHNFGTPMWEGLQLLRTIRNRITHPKSAMDLSVSHEEISIVSISLDKLLEMITSDMDAVIVSMRKYYDDIVEISSKIKEGDPTMTALAKCIKAELEN